MRSITLWGTPNSDEQISELDLGGSSKFEVTTPEHPERTSIRPLPFEDLSRGVPLLLAQVGEVEERWPSLDEIVRDIVRECPAHHTIVAHLRLGVGHTPAMWVTRCKDEALPPGPPLRTDRRSQRLGEGNLNRRRSAIRLDRPIPR